MTNSSGRAKGRILIVDVHPVTRAGYRAAISAEADLEVCGEAACGSEALRLARDRSPDLVVMDVGCGGGGLELCRSLRAAWPEQMVLIISARDETLYALPALRAGARGYLGKREAVGRLIAGMQAVLEGKYVLSAAMSSRVVARAVCPRAGRATPAVAGLTDRGPGVFESASRGLTAVQIATRRDLSRNAVQTYRKGVKRKLGLENAVQLSHGAVGATERG